MKAKKSIGQKELVSNHFKCNICKDAGYIFTIKNGYEMAEKCRCKLIEETKQKLNNSGLGDLLETKTFKSYIAKEDYQRNIKKIAIEYTKAFLKGNRHSLALLGQSGIGKTHIMTAVSKQMIDRNIEVKYYIADEIIQTLSACKFDEDNYNIEFSKIANARVLFIDDLFKSSVQNYYNKGSIDKNDLREMFKVINYRYNKRLPILLSSELHFEKFAELDQALIGRINEMCNYEYLVSIKPDADKNYRLNRR